MHKIAAIEISTACFISFLNAHNTVISACQSSVLSSTKCVYFYVFVHIHAFVHIFKVYPEEFLPTYHSIKEGATITKALLVSLHSDVGVSFSSSRPVPECVMIHMNILMNTTQMAEIKRVNIRNHACDIMCL